MAANPSSSLFTNAPPPLIGALLRFPWQAVQRHMLQRLHERGFADFDPASLTVFQYPGPQDARPSELATRLGISKQALNHLLGQLEKLGYLERRPDAHDPPSKRAAVRSERATSQLQSHSF